jgi:succinoglycan biosynthesis protein ExoM
LADADRVRVAVCICTHRRVDLLERLLERLTLVAADAAAVADLGVVLVDDDPDGSARELADRWRSKLPGGIVYACTGASDFAVARNRALELGAASAEWLAITDDDCLPGADWVRQLLTVAQREGAELVTGACRDEPPPGAPAWLREQPFLGALEAEADGAAREVGHIKNCLVSADVLRRHQLRFEEDYGREGGEDVMFFYRAAALGVRHRYAARALVTEAVPAARATFAYQLRRRFWYGTTEARTSVAASRASRLRMAAAGGKLVLLGILGPVHRAARRRPPQVRWALAEALQGLGRVAGAAGLRIAHR